MAKCAIVNRLSDHYIQHLDITLFLGHVGEAIVTVCDGLYCSYMIVYIVVVNNYNDTTECLLPL